MGTYYGLKRGTELHKIIEEVNKKRDKLNKVYRELNDRTRDFLGINRDIRYNYTINSDEGSIIYIIKEDYLLLEDEEKEKFETFKVNKYKVKNVSSFGYKEKIKEYVKRNVENYRKAVYVIREFNLYGKHVIYNKEQYFLTNEGLEEYVVKIDEDKYLKNLCTEEKDLKDKINKDIAKIEYIIRVKELEDEDYNYLSKRLSELKQRKIKNKIIKVNKKEMEAIREDINRYKRVMSKVG